MVGKNGDVYIVFPQEVFHQIVAVKSIQQILGVFIGHSAEDIPVQKIQFLHWLGLWVGPWSLRRKEKET